MYMIKTMREQRSKHAVPDQLCTTDRSPPALQHLWTGAALSTSQWKCVFKEEGEKPVITLVLAAATAGCRVYIQTIKKKMPSHRSLKCGGLPCLHHFCTIDCNFLGVQQVPVIEQIMRKSRLWGGGVQPHPHLLCATCIASTRSSRACQVVPARAALLMQLQNPAHEHHCSSHLSVSG